MKWVTFQSASASTRSSRKPLTKMGRMSLASRSRLLPLQKVKKKQKVSSATSASRSSNKNKTFACLKVAVVGIHMLPLDKVSDMRTMRRYENQRAEHYSYQYRVLPQSAENRRYAAW